MTRAGADQRRDDREGCDRDGDRNVALDPADRDACCCCEREGQRDPVVAVEQPTRQEGGDGEARSMPGMRTAVPSDARMRMQARR